MLKNLILTIIFCGFFLSSPVAMANIPIGNAPQASISDLIAYNADIYHIPEKTLYKTIACESSFNLKAHRLTYKENSWGLVQINLKAHKNITKAEALDPSFSIGYLAKNLSTHHGSMWSCYTKTKEV